MNFDKKYVVTLDEGTTSTRTLVINKKGEIVSSAQLEFTQYFPASGHVEHDAVEIWNNQRTTLLKALAKVKADVDEIAAIGITNQRETVVMWNKETGVPIHNAIVWQDTRTASYCTKISKKKILIRKRKVELPKEVNKRTGLVINPYFSGTKIRWLLENVKEARQLAKEGKLLVGTIDTWLIWKLTGGEVHVTDVSNASRTLLFNIKTLKWDKQLLAFFDIPESILPEVKSSSEVYGYVTEGFFQKNKQTRVPIAGVAGDQQAALFGQLCLEPGDVKNTYGTGCFMLVNTGTKLLYSKNQLLTTIAWQLGSSGKVIYALEGAVFITGAAIQWLRDQVRLIYHSSESEFYAALSVKTHTHDIYVVPAFNGLGAPYWDTSARGAIFGLERGTKREHIVGATLESIAFQSNDVINAMRKDSKLDIKRVKIDGGASVNNYLAQFQADISQTTVVRPKNVETTALGAAFLAGLAVGFWENTDEIAASIARPVEFTPKMDPKEAKQRNAKWVDAVSRTRGWLK